MNQFDPKKLITKIFNSLFSTSASGLYIVLFALSIAAATFVENDFGTSSAQKVIFKSWWLELLLMLFCISLVVNIFRFRMIQQKKWGILVFHASMIIILIGAGVTRYFGSEGIMHIREGSASGVYLSSEEYLKFEVQHQQRRYLFEEPVLFASLGQNHFNKSYQIGDRQVNVEILDFLPNPEETIIADKKGVPMLKIVIGGTNGREEYVVKYHDQVNIRGTLFNFGNPEIDQAFNVSYANGRLSFKTAVTFVQMQMATQTRDTLDPGSSHPLLLRSLYTSGTRSFVISEFVPNGKLEIVSSSNKMTSSSTAGLNMKITVDNEVEQFYLFGNKGLEGRPRAIEIADTRLSVAYGAKKVTLPFSIRLNEFIMDRYPGTNSASSYASEVTLVDPQHNINRNQRIYMNHILNYRGYRFFQSSFDQDELGTYLSVNRDGWGTWLSYIGYALLTIGMVLTLFSSKSRFTQVAQKIQKMRNSDTALTSVLVGFLLAISVPTQAAEGNELNIAEVNTDHAQQFGRLVVQDYKGRFKPMNTFVNEVLRKLSRKQSIYGLSAEQVILGMAANPKDWYGVPMIKLGKNQEIKRILQTSADMISYRDFFEQQGDYKLKNIVRTAYNTPPKERGAFEKELLKLDEKVNICSMIFSGRFMKTFPQSGTANGWQTPADGHHHHEGHAHQADEETSYAEDFYPAYVIAIQQALVNHDWTDANTLIAELHHYQQSNGGALLPSESKIGAELWLNKLAVFGRLGKLYGLLGVGFLIILFISVFNPEVDLKWPFRITFSLLILGFIMHTLGLSLRWYVSGRAPWSNGYESMIYIAFTTVLAGLLFSRKSYGGLAATSVLSATILMVAGLSWLDPEITPLVPVLKSYWLTIHVSLEAGSYGFLMLGAIIGVINLILMIVANQKNGKKVYRIIKEMTYISEMTLIGGLFMISIGTYLGGVWANESWGRYWGWDAKETWALVTILVYAFILHMRFIPGFRGPLAFNVASLFGWSSVMMTYFGVNYYLSGLHSYAAGDPVPIPSFVYYTVVSLIAIGFLAYWRNNQYGKTRKLKTDKSVNWLALNS